MYIHNWRCLPVYIYKQFFISRTACCPQKFQIQARMEFVNIDYSNPKCSRINEDVAQVCLGGKRTPSIWRVALVAKRPKKNWKKGGSKSKRKNITAPGEDQTRDLLLTKRMHYHYATEAGYVDLRYILYNSQNTASTMAAAGTCRSAKEDELWCHAFQPPFAEVVAQRPPRISFTRAPALQ